MSKNINIKTDKEKETAYAALCFMKMLCRNGNLSKSQYTSMVKLCSAHFDTSDFLSGVSFLPVVVFFILYVCISAKQ